MPIMSLESLAKVVHQSCFMLLDKKGSELVIKMLFVDVPENSYAKGGTGIDKASKEASNLKSHYSFLQDKAHTATINNHACVVMPFFRPLPKAFDAICPILSPWMVFENTARLQVMILGSVERGRLALVYIIITILKVHSVLSLTTFIDVY